MLPERFIAIMFAAWTITAASAFIPYQSNEFGLLPGWLRVASLLGIFDFRLWFLPIVTLKSKESKIKNIKPK